MYILFLLWKLISKNNNYFPLTAATHKSISSGLFICLIVSTDNIVLNIFWNQSDLNHLINSLTEFFMSKDVNMSSLDVPKYKPPFDITKSTLLSILNDSSNIEQSIRELSLKPYTPKFSYIPPVLHYYDTPFYLLGLLADSISHKISFSDFLFSSNYYYESLCTLGQEFTKLGPNIIIPSLYSSFIVYSSFTSSSQLNEAEASDSDNSGEDPEINNTEADDLAENQEINNSDTEINYDSDATQQGWDDNEPLSSSPVYYSAPDLYIPPPSPPIPPQLMGQTILDQWPNNILLSFTNLNAVNWGGNSHFTIDYTNLNYAWWETYAELIETAELVLPPTFDLSLNIAVLPSSIPEVDHIYVDDVTSNLDGILDHIQNLIRTIRLYSALINEGAQSEDGTIHFGFLGEHVREDILGRYLTLRILELIYRRYNPDYNFYRFQSRYWPLIAYHNP